MNPPSAPTSRVAAAILRTRPALWFPLLGLALYGLMLARYAGAYAGGADSSGYMNNARLLDRGNLVVPMRQVQGVDPGTMPPFTYVPLGFTPRHDRVTMVPVYSMGLPLMLVAMAHVAGWNCAPVLTIVLNSLSGLWLVYLLGREFGLERGWAWLGAMLLAASPLYVFMSLQLMSDVAALAWVTAAVLCAWRSRERPWLALLAGAAMSIAVLDRPTNLLTLLPAGIALGPGIRRWILFAAGGLPGAVFLGIVNHAIYGRVLATGYGPVGGMLSAGNVPVTLLHYAVWLPALFTPVVVLFFGLPVIRRRLPLQSALLCAWAAVFLGFYVFYYCTHETWWYLRFILPAVPPLLVGALLAARELAGRLRLAPGAGWLAAAAVAVLIHGFLWFRHFELSNLDRGERIYPEGARWMQSHVPGNAVVLSMQTSGALFFYTGFTVVRWDCISPAEFERIAAACAAAGRPVYASLFPFEIRDQGAFPGHLTGRWTQIAAFSGASVWRRDPPEDRR